MKNVIEVSSSTPRTTGFVFSVKNQSKQKHEGIFLPTLKFSQSLVQKVAGKTDKTKWIFQVKVALENSPQMTTKTLNYPRPTLNYPLSASHFLKVNRFASWFWFMNLLVPLQAAQFCQSIPFWLGQSEDSIEFAIVTPLSLGWCKMIAFKKSTSTSAENRKCVSYMLGEES